MRRLLIASNLLLAGLLAACVSPAAQRLGPGDLKISRPGARAVVVVHSRSGNTSKVALETARLMNADYYRLEVPAGSGDSYGSAPNRNANVEIKPATIDLKRYDLVFLGSPIWFWHPTAFIYSFAEKNDLRGKKIVLFYTYQGGISKNAVSEFTAAVQKKGGRVVGTMGINRKSFKTDASLREETGRLVESGRKQWK